MCAISPNHKASFNGSIVAFLVPDGHGDRMAAGTFLIKLYIDNLAPTLECIDPVARNLAIKDTLYLTLRT
jgi:hypothetical protein